MFLKLRFFYWEFISKWFVNCDIKRPIIPFTQNLFFWRPRVGVNVGDELSKVVFEETLKYLHLKKHFCFKTTIMSCVGSILSQLPNTKITVWGTGLIFKSENKRVHPDNLIIFALRGPNTVNALREIGYKFKKHIPLGDPAILMPLYYSPTVKKVKGKILIIPHFSKTNDYKSKYNNVYDTKTADWKGFIDEILSSEKVISSSLHGIILAESYGIPALLLN